MPTEAQRKAYESVMEIFDKAEDILDTAEKYDADVVKPYLNDINDAVLTVEKNTEVMIDNLLSCISKNKKISGVEKMRIEKAADEAKKALRSFLDRIGKEMGEE